MTTVAEWKKHITKQLKGDGYELSKKNPYWFNNKAISYLKDLIQHTIENHDLTDRQRESLDNWLIDCKQKYLMEL